MKKRILCLLLALLMLCSTVSAAITPGKPKYGSGYATNVTLTGDLASDIITVAKAQRSKGKSELGYSSAWCDAFVVDCARIANVPTSVIPNTRGCKALYDAILKAGGTKVTTPKAGDIVLYYCSTCKNYPHIGLYAGNNYTCEGNVSNSVSYSDRTKVFYQDGSGHTSKSTVKAYYVRPNYTNATVHTLSFNANGGSGSMSSTTAVYGAGFTLPANTFTRSGYTFAGWSAQRSDGKWHCVGQGWKTEAEIAANGYTKTVYKDQVSGTFNTSWTTGTTGACSVTFYAQWTVATYDVFCYHNSSGKNYFIGTDFRTSVDSANFSSRDTSVHTVGWDASSPLEGCGSMKITAVSAGSSGKDMLWHTTTNVNNTNDGGIGDEKAMTMSFWAKGTPGAKLHIRWGYQPTSEYKTVTMTSDWTYYTLSMDKIPAYGYNIHPYFDKAGTYWIAGLQLEDGTAATDFVPEAGQYTKVSATYGGTYSLPAAPEGKGSFLGWYTSAQGGQRVDNTTAVKPGKLFLYARWPDGTTHTHSYTSRVTQVPTYAPGVRTYTCACGSSYTEAIAPIVDLCLGIRGCPSDGFNDVQSGSWYHYYVDYVVENGLMNGTSASTFAPEGSMTRGMLVTVLWRYAGMPKEGSNTFSDVPNGTWYTDAVAWAAHNNVVSGTGNGKFAPNDNITREQLAVILYRYCRNQGIDVSGKASLSSFSDSAKVSSWAAESLQWAVNEGLLEGSGGKLLPQGNASRAQVATVLARFLETIVK